MSSENLNNLSIKELKKLVKEKNEVVKKLEQEEEKEKLIQAYKKLQKKEKKLRQENQESKTKTKTKQKSIPKQKAKSFDEYFQECIKNKIIPKDTPPYFKKALLRAMKEYEAGIKHEKSAFKKFAEKFVIDGKPGLTPIQYFTEKEARIKDFLRNHRNIKVRMILICEMERKESIDGGRKFFTQTTKAHFNTDIHKNLESTDVKVIFSQMIQEIMEKNRQLSR